jgi:protoporphyrinogen oxidase
MAEQKGERLGSSGSVDTLILGAGLCGMSAAYHLQEAGAGDLLILERDDRPGGLARTERHGEFAFDRSIHILYTDDEYVASWICDDLLRDNLVRQSRRSFCYSHGIYTEYPYQLNNHGLPADVIAANILGLIEAHEARAGNAPPANYEEWILQTFGRGIAENFMLPYNRRQWAWDLKLMSYSWVGERVPMPRLEDVVRGALQPPSQRMGPNRDFWYPREGGIEALARSLAPRLRPGTVRLGTEVVGVDWSSKTVRCADGSSIGYRRLVSTLPLPRLIGLMREVPAEVSAAAAGLRSNVVHTVNVGLRGGVSTGAEPMHWVYFPHDETVFHRISFPHEFSPFMAPPGCSSIQAEISESSHRPVDRDNLIEQTLAGLCRVGLLTESEARPSSDGGRVEVAEVVTLEPAYVIYDLWHEENTTLIAEWLGEHDVETRGRFGEWEYFNMDHSMLSGKHAAETTLPTARR